MDKIYGYKQQDAIDFAKFINQNPKLTPAKLYSRYAIISGKSIGTIRNLYYALAKKSREDSDFCQKHLSGKPLTVSEILPFSSAEERKLIKDVLTKKRDGYSVRKAILEMAGGDVKLSLRFQNKYRGAIKSKPWLIEEITKEINLERGEISGRTNVNSRPEISEFQMARLKKEINGLMERVSHKTRKENAKLKERIAFLESENLRLINMLYGSSAVKYFNRQNEQTIN